MKNDVKVPLKSKREKNFGIKTYFLCGILSAIFEKKKSRIRIRKSMARIRGYGFITRHGSTTLIKTMLIRNTGKNASCQFTWSVPLLTLTISWPQVPTSSKGSKTSRRLHVFHATSNSAGTVTSNQSRPSYDGKYDAEQFFPEFSSNCNDPLYTALSTLYLSTSGVQW